MVWLRLLADVGILLRFIVVMLLLLLLLCCIIVDGLCRAPFKPKVCRVDSILKLTAIWCSSEITANVANNPAVMIGVPGRIWLSGRSLCRGTGAICLMALRTGTIFCVAIRHGGCGGNE